MEGLETEEPQNASRPVGYDVTDGTKGRKDVSTEGRKCREEFGLNIFFQCINLFSLDFLADASLARECSRNCMETIASVYFKTFAIFCVPIGPSSPSGNACHAAPYGTVLAISCGA